MGNKSNIFLIGLFAFVLTTGFVGSQQALAVAIVIDDFENSAGNCNFNIDTGASSGTDSTTTGVIPGTGDRFCEVGIQISNSPSTLDIDIDAGDNGLYRYAESTGVGGAGNLTYGNTTPLNTDFSGQDSIDIHIDAADQVIPFYIILESGGGAQVGILLMSTAVSGSAQTLNYPLGSFSGALDFTDIDKITVLMDPPSNAGDFSISLIDTTMSVKSRAPLKLPNG